MDRSKKTSGGGQTPAPQGEGVGRGFLVAIGLMVIAVALLLFIRRPSPPPAAPATVAEADPAAGPGKVARPGSLAGRPVPAAPKVDEPPKTLPERWGVEVLSVRLTMADTMADVRYKLLDADKAKQLADGKTQAFVIDQPSGTKLKVPTPPAEGAFPPSGNKLIPGRTYFALVSNRGHVLRRGTRVTVVIGESQVADVAVE